MHPKSTQALDGTKQKVNVSQILSLNQPGLMPYPGTMDSTMLEDSCVHI